MIDNLLRKIFKQRDIILATILVAVIVISYSKVLFIFFQQDELYMFGTFINWGWKTLTVGLLSSSISHVVPFSLVISYVIYLLFGLNYLAFNSFGLAIHLLNGLLIFRLAKLFFKSKTFSLIASIFFLSSYQASEMVMWPVASLNTLSLTFVLGIWLFFLNNAGREKQFKWADGIIISTLFLLALFTIEYSFMFALFFPLVVVFDKRVNKRSSVKILLPFFFVVISYVLLRFAPTVQTAGGSVGITTGINTFLTLPFVYISQLFVSQNILLDIAGRFSHDAFVVETEVYKYMALIMGVVLYLSILFLVAKVKKLNKKAGSDLLFFLVFIFASSLPFILILGGPDSSWIIPSRYLYFGTVGYSLVVTFLVSRISKNKAIFSFMLTIVAILLLVGGVYSNYTRSSSLYVQGKVRLDILNQVKNNHPRLPVKVIFYFLSDASYYGLPDQEKILPFQSGLGHTLLVWYAKTEKFPKGFFADRFLWDITSQGYKEIEGVGFGFFRDFGKMAGILKDKNLPSTSIISFSYDSKFNKLKDITAEVRGEYLGFLAEKEEVKPSGYLIIAKSNEADIFLATDRNRNTFWDSKVVYAYPQSLEIKLKRKTRIAQIQIDSYNNKDQNQVGYKVSLADDNGNWHEVFYAKRYSPNPDGIVNLYFEPTKTRGVKIEQMGYHAFATWVVHELKVYEMVD